MSDPAKAPTHLTVQQQRDKEKLGLIKASLYAEAVQNALTELWHSEEGKIAKQIARMVYQSCFNNPYLRECTPESLMKATMQCAELQLYPDPILGHAYLVPFKNHGTAEATVIVGYRGLISLATRGGSVLSVKPWLVYKADTFEEEAGSNDRLIHKPRAKTIEEKDIKNVTHAYAVAKLANGGVQWRVLDRDEIEARRQRSRAKDKGPWVTDTKAMMLKTAIRALCPILPISIDDQRRVSIAEAREINPVPGMEDVPEGPMVDIIPSDDPPPSAPSKLDGMAEDADKA